MDRVRLLIPDCPTQALERLERELGVGPVLAQVLVRRGLGDPDRARTFLFDQPEHDPGLLPGIEPAVERVLRHVRAGSRITVHGDYDVDGVCSTAVAVRALRRLGACVDWYLPDRLQDGYGLAAGTVERLAERGTRMLLTVDCAVTAVEEVALARRLGVEVVVSDHHSPRADGLLPDAPVVHPGLGGYPCPELCATAVAHKLAQALFRAAGRDPRELDEDLDLVALATVCDVVPLVGENRRLVRSGLRALAGTGKVGLRALMEVSGVDPSRPDTQSLGFRLGPRINAAGRLYSAAAGLELLLTEDVERAAAVAAELDRVNLERRDTETRILFEAEGLLASAGELSAHVVAGEGWHPGVVGIVASRLAERHHRPVVVVALDGERGRGSGRSIPGFDLLDGLRAAGEHLERFGGHRAAAGLEVARDALPAFAAAFAAHAASVLGPDDLLPTERIDAVVGGEDLGLELAEELSALEPFGSANPPVSLLLRGAVLDDVRGMGEGRHLRFTVRSGAVRARAVAFGTGPRLPAGGDGGPVDASFSLEVNLWRGVSEPRLVLRRARPAGSVAARLIENSAGGYLPAVWEELDAPLPTGEDVDGAAVGALALARRSPRVHDERGRGVAGALGALVARGEPVLVAVADGPARERHLRGRLGGFDLVAHATLARHPQLARGYAHLFLLDPPALASVESACMAACAGHRVHLGWGEAELRFSQAVFDMEYDLRGSLGTLYRVLRDVGEVRGDRLQDLLRGESEGSRSPALAGRLLRVLSELDLVVIDRERAELRVPPAERTELERSSAFRAYETTLRAGRRYLRSSTPRAA